MQPVRTEDQIVPLDLLATCPGHEAHALHMRLSEMLPYFDGAIRAAKKHSPALRDWLQKLKTDLA